MHYQRQQYVHAHFSNHSLWNNHSRHLICFIISLNFQLIAHTFSLLVFSSVLCFLLSSFVSLQIARWIQSGWSTLVQTAQKGDHGQETNVKDNDELVSLVFCLLYWESLLRWHHATCGDKDLVSSLTCLFLFLISFLFLLWYFFWM